jgi:hypothetical protein
MLSPRALVSQRSLSLRTSARAASRGAGCRRLGRRHIVHAARSTPTATGGQSAFEFEED